MTNLAAWVYEAWGRHRMGPGVTVPVDALHELLGRLRAAEQVALAAEQRIRVSVEVMPDGGQEKAPAPGGGGGDYCEGCGE